jgi:hypothetical protein
MSSFNYSGWVSPLKSCSFGDEIISLMEWMIFMIDLFSRST